MTVSTQRICWPSPGCASLWRELIGVTQDAHEALHEPPPPTVFGPLITEGTDLRGVTYAIRSERAGTESFAAEVRQAVWASHPDIVIRLRTLDDIYTDALAQTSFVLVLLALGARPPAVQRLFVLQGVAVAAIGIAAAAASSRFLTSLLFGVQPLDLPTYAVVLAVLLAAIALAAYLPARRAANLAPAQTLRAE